MQIIGIGPKNPNPREKASFLKENLMPMQESGHLKFIGNDGDVTLPKFRNYSYFGSHGKNDDPQDKDQRKNRLLYGRPITFGWTHTLTLRDGL